MPTQLAHRSATRRRLRALGLFAAFSVAGSLVTPIVADAATKKAKPKGPSAGQACSPIGAHAPGTSLDCVAVGSKKQWQPKGTKLNPYRIGETFEWTQSSNGRNPGALISTRRITVVGYLPDASEWVSQWTDNQPQDIFDQARGAQVRGVRATFTLVSATDASSRNLGSLSTLWLGDDRDAGCCTQGALSWSRPPAEGLDPFTRLEDGASLTGVVVFARTNEQIGKRPLMRLAWIDVANKSVFFDVLPS